MQQRRTIVEILLAICVASIILNRAQGAVEALNATFNGADLSVDETRDRLIEDGWAYDGDAVIQNDELVLTNRGGIDPDSDFLNRDMGGYGSFRLSTVLRDVDLGNYQEPYPAAAFNLVETALEFKSEESITFLSSRVGEVIDIKERDDNTQWGLGATMGSSGVGRFVTKTTDTMEFELTFNARQESFTLRWDANANDNVAPSVIGTLIADRDLSDTNTTFLTFHVLAGEHTIANARLQSITVTPLSDIEGDFSNSRTLDIRDVNTLSAEIHAKTTDPWFDLTLDDKINQGDLQYWIHDLKKTYYGDANLDGEFNSADLVDIFAVGKYEDGISTNARWESGDWNADLEFDTSDLVVAFQDGGYEQGPRAVVAVPEAMSLPMAILGGIYACAASRWSRSRASQRNVRWQAPLDCRRLDGSPLR